MAELILIIVGTLVVCYVVSGLLRGRREDRKRKRGDR